ncbi:MAG: hypothetical protein EHM40_00315 [Chloroflexi bacterium]|nr:MAG: hypothetical protein EHM40_16245 [Chloroflexota bacterium]RPI96850.1 MAG: hypothetical protein EHM40_00315 [Chloroflexota bacterium]
MKSLRPLLFFVSMLLIVVLAGGCRSAQPESTGPRAIEGGPTATPPPTDTPAPQSQGGEAQAFFGEEFDNALSGDWKEVLIYDEDISDPEKATANAGNGKLSWNIDTKDFAHYLFYGAYSYDDVKLEVSADNRGVNNTTVSLICRADPEVGWYQFSVTNSGLYEIRYIEKLAEGKFKKNHIANGGSMAIKQGKGVNEYGATCQGDRLTLYINGEKVASLQETSFAVREGQVGVGVASTNSLPVSVDIDWFKVTAP